MFAVGTGGANEYNGGDNRRGKSYKQKKENRVSDSLVGHLGLEICLVKTHRLCCLLSAQPVQTNGTEEITVGASPTNKKENRVSDSLRGPSWA